MAVARHRAVDGPALGVDEIAGCGPYATGRRRRDLIRHALSTRLLHLLLASAVLIQLVDTQVMGVPRPGRILDGLQAGAFGVHEYVGLFAMLVVTLFWAWPTVRRVGTEPGRLFPWFNAQRRAELWADIRLHFQLARRLALPDPEHSETLAAATHGLGLLSVLFMAGTGTIGWLGWDQAAGMGGFTRTIFEAHGLVANLLWAYVVIHVGTVLLHEAVGHRLVQRMNPLPDY
jgi:cytochrome b561